MVTFHQIVIIIGKKELEIFPQKFMSSLPRFDFELRVNIVLKEDDICKKSITKVNYVIC